MLQLKWEYREHCIYFGNELAQTRNRSLGIYLLLCIIYLGGLWSAVSKLFLVYCSVDADLRQYTIDRSVDLDIWYAADLSVHLAIRHAIDVSIDLRRHCTIDRQGRLQNRQSLIVEIDRHPRPERVLQSRNNLRRLERVFRRTAHRPPIKHRTRELLQIINKRRVVQGKRIRRRSSPHTMNIAYLNTVDRRVPTDDSVGLCAADACCAFVAVGQGAAQVRGEDFAVGEFDHAPAVVAVAVLGQIAVDGLLAHGDDSVDLSFGIGQVGFDVEEVAADVDLWNVSARQ